MKKRRLILITILIIGVGAVIGGVIIGRILRPKKGLLIVESDPITDVYINDEKVGTTPYEGELTAQELTLRLTPEDANLLPYETKLKLNPGVKTIVRRKLGEAIGTSSGVTIYFVKTGIAEADISVISMPDEADVIFDKTRHRTPVTITNIAPGEHFIIIRKDGYAEKTLSVVAEKNHNLTININLEEATEPLPAQEPQGDQKIEILDTPTGFLRVRSEPNGTSPEVAKVIPGETFNFIKENEDGGWLNIELSATESGWISSEYALR